MANTNTSLPQEVDLTYTIFSQIVKDGYDRIVQGNCKSKLGYDYFEWLQTEFSRSMHGLLNRSLARLEEHEKPLLLPRNCVMISSVGSSPNPNGATIC